MMRTEGSFTKAPAVVPRPGGIDFPTSNHAKGRNRFCAYALHFDTLWDERTGDENRLLSHFFLFPPAPLTGVSASEAPVAIRAVTAATITLFTTQKYTRWLALQIVKQSRTEHEKE